MPLTPDAKKLLAETIRGSAQDPERGLRARLLRAIHDEADRRYRLSVPIAEAGLDETHRRRRERIEAWIDERARASKPKNKAERSATERRLLAQAEREAAATLVNRLVLVRHLEALDLSKPAVVTGGWSSKGYRELREFAPTLCTNDTADATEGYAALLQLLFDELAGELPGLFGDVGLTRLFPIPAAALRDVIERLDDAKLASAWTDDTTLGWVYQFWNDPDREALDAKIHDGGKIEPHEIASKTQMFTERYMVEWLLQNSLGLTWLCMCKQRGWTADAERVLPLLDERRAAWRKQREAGEKRLDELMPLLPPEKGGELEQRWKYYVPQPIPDDAVERAPASVRAIKLLDPACGSGHFLVIAFDLLAALYREEARHLGAEVSNEEIAESILEHNLYGIDIDPRATQLAAASLYLKARALAKPARPRPKAINLVAPVLQLGHLPADDAAVVALKRELEREVGIPQEVTSKLLTALAGVDYLGSLLKVDAAVDEAIESVERERAQRECQGHLLHGFPAQQVSLPLGARATMLDKLEQFLAKRSKSEDLGLRLDGEQLTAGVRFVRMAKEGTYDLVVGNPPYQGLSKTAAFGYVATKYPAGKADLYAAFLLRGLEVVRLGGLVALVTMRGWMFLGQFASLRAHLLSETDLRTLGDLGTGAFSSRSMDDVISTSLVVSRRSAPGRASRAIQAGPLADPRRDAGKPARREAALLAQDVFYEFDPRGFEVIEGEPIVYWWSKEFLARYAAAPKLGASAPARFGLNTGNNVRFLRKPWELHSRAVTARRLDCEPAPLSEIPWSRFLKGAAGTSWIDSCDDCIRWWGNGLEVKVLAESLYGSHSRQIRNERVYWRPGVAFTMIGSEFSARAHRFRCVIGDKGSSVYADDVPGVLCVMNRREARDVLGALNPSISFQVGDVNRLPVFPVLGADEVYERLLDAFGEHERARETSVEFRAPGGSPWVYAQSWAQRSVDRPKGDPLPPYNPECQAPPAASIVSSSVGIALGRFGAEGEGTFDIPPLNALPGGILFVTCEGADSLDNQACAVVGETWRKHGAAVGEGDDLRTYLRKSFFDYHKKLYENRPIYFPLSSAKKSFVVFVSIHLWADDTLNVVLADYLVPTKRRLEGELDDLRTAKASGGGKGKAERRFTEVQRLLEELHDFIAKVTQIAERGPPPPDDKTTKREADARFVMDLDDGVMVNSAALWPLLEPQWKDPKKWWKELALASGKKDYDWSHLAARYFPTRVRKKCHDDPSLAVAHKCFWVLHPAKAYAWELRLQDEIRADFTIDEPGSDEARAKFLREHEREAREILTKELKRREKKSANDVESETGPLFDRGGERGDERGDEQGGEAEELEGALPRSLTANHQGREEEE